MTKPLLYPTVWKAFSFARVPALRPLRQRGEWLVPLKRATIPSKPPLFHWSAALVTRLTGAMTEATIRFPSALYATLGLLLVYWLGRKIYDARPTNGYSIRPSSKHAYNELPKLLDENRADQSRDDGRETTEDDAARAEAIDQPAADGRKQHE